MSKYEEFIDKKFGKLKVIKCVGKSQSNSPLFECKCDCGNTTYAYSTQLRNGHKKSCGCLKKEHHFEYKQKIADLEAKLAESEERINWLVEAEFNRKWAKKYVEMRRKEDPMLCLPDSDEVYEKYFELKQQLADKEEQLNNSEQKCLICYKEQENEKLKQQLAEKDNRIKKLNMEAQKYYEDAYCNDFYNQDKISFAVDILEELADCSNYINSKLDFECGSYVSEKAIRDKIKYLKGKKDE